MSSSTNAGMPQFTVAPIDPKSGRWNREWWLFFQSLWDRTGGSQGVTTSDLGADLPEDAGIEEIKADVYRDRDSAWSMPPYLPQMPVDDLAPPRADQPPIDSIDGRVASLEALVAMLMGEIQSLNLGPQT